MLLLAARVAAGRIARFFPAVAEDGKILHLAFLHAAHCALATRGVGDIEAGQKAFTHRSAAKQMHGGPVAGQWSGQIVFYLH